SSDVFMGFLPRERAMLATWKRRLPHQAYAPTSAPAIQRPALHRARPADRPKRCPFIFEGSSCDSSLNPATLVGGEERASGRGIYFPPTLVMRTDPMSPASQS